jgi:hypothetical protein
MNDEDFAQLTTELKRIGEDVSSIKKDIRVLIKLARLLDALLLRETSRALKETASDEFKMLLGELLHKHEIPW